ncbi:MAG TPA: hypothetical protein VE910_06925, partial [Dongiaceae bacterium]|nr:hypothetical protein [Dongiaceae bacterium]
SERANARFADYIRDNIRKRVRDPDVAEQLLPDGHFVGERRTLIEDRYFEIYNQPNVTLVNVKRNPIEEFTQAGLRAGGKEYELDMIILATGFDSGTGTILRIDIRGENGLTIKDKWSKEIYTYLGLMIGGFPNLFSVDGPGSPSIRSNMLAACEQHGDLIVELLQYARERDVSRIEVTHEAEEVWTQHVEDLARATLLMRNVTQYCGGNVPGKLHRYLAYVGGLGRYREVCELVRDRGYEGFVMTTPNGVLPSKRTWSGPSANEGAKMRGENTVI